MSTTTLIQTIFDKVNNKLIINLIENNNKITTYYLDRSDIKTITKLDTTKYGYVVERKKYEYPWYFYITGKYKTIIKYQNNRSFVGHDTLKAAQDELIEIIDYDKAEFSEDLMTLSSNRPCIQIVVMQFGDLVNIQIPYDSHEELDPIWDEILSFLK